MFGIAQGPAKQTATDAINILSGRLQSATLLEDRRSAILGLRSFARQFPASVASGALRGLISSLSKDGEDVDTVKIVLETLLMLINPDETSPEASEEIALWLADEFTQRQDNITILLDLLDTSDFYSRLYSLQFLVSILSSRTERTEECIFSAPLGISRLVAILDDRREAVRNEGLSLLTYLTPNSSELQKLVAFENAFDRIFTIIKLEGSLSSGDRVVEDCLILLSNLLRMNASNQSFFRETAYVPKLTLLLKDALIATDSEEGLAEWARLQRNRNIYALLAVLRLFLVWGGVGTQANQESFWQHGIPNQVLQLAFSHSTEMQIKAEALVTCSDLIRGNPDLQEAFAQLQVTPVLYNPDSEEDTKSRRMTKVYVIDGLLDLTLSVPSLPAFNARAAACECVKAYFYNHSTIRLHFLRRAIGGHASGADETANIFTILLSPTEQNYSSDPYRCWFAAVLLFHLIFEDAEAKNLAMSVAEGDASSGEEVVTCIQSIAANLITAMQKGEDDRVLIGFLMLLCGWLFEDPDAVNDFLGEGSCVQSLVQAILQGDRDGIVVQGLCAVLLGVVYEFSTKDSPLPRTTLHSVLTSRMGRDQYIDRITKLRRHPLLRDFEVLPQKMISVSQGGLPEIYFDKTFVDFVKDNFSRLVRSIDCDPAIEIPVDGKGGHKGISREMVDSLRLQLEEKENALRTAKSDLIFLEGQLSQERADHRKDKEITALEISRIKDINDALQRHHEEESSKLREDHNFAIRDLQKQVDTVKVIAQEDSARIRSHTEAEIADLKATIASLEVNLEKANRTHLQDLQAAYQESNAKLATQREKLEGAEERARNFEVKYEGAHQKELEFQALMEEKDAQKAAVQSDLDDLLLVLGDLEDKTAKYKQRLLDLGGVVSDGEED